MAPSRGHHHSDESSLGGPLSQGQKAALGWVCFSAPNHCVGLLYRVLLLGTPPRVLVPHVTSVTLSVHSDGFAGFTL